MMIEKQSYESFVIMEGDDTVYNIDPPDVLLNQLDHNVEVRETKKQETKKKGLEIFMEKDV